MCIHAFAFYANQPEKAHLVLFSAFTRANKSRIMADLEQENDVYKETLAQFQGEMNTSQGNMNTILEYIQAQKATTSSSVVIHATVVVTDVVVIATYVDAIMDTVIQPVVSQPICQTSPSRHVASKSWDLPPNFTPHAANGNVFVPYQPFNVHPANGNYVSHPWGMTIHSPQIVNTDNREINLEQTL